MHASGCPQARGSLIQGWHSLIPRSYSHSPRNAPLRPRSGPATPQTSDLAYRSYHTMYRSLPYSLMEKKPCFIARAAQKKHLRNMYYVPAFSPSKPRPCFYPCLSRVTFSRSAYTRCAPCGVVDRCVRALIGSFFRSFAQVRRSYPAICLVDRRDRWRHCRCQQPPSCRRRAACSTPKRVSSHF